MLNWWRWLRLKCSRKLFKLIIAIWLDFPHQNLLPALITFPPSVAQESFNSFIIVHDTKEEKNTPRKRDKDLLFRWQRIPLRIRSGRSFVCAPNWLHNIAASHILNHLNGSKRQRDVHRASIADSFSSSFFVFSSSFTLLSLSPAAGFFWIICLILDGTFFCVRRSLTCPRLVIAKASFASFCRVHCSIGRTLEPRKRLAVGPCRWNYVLCIRRKTFHVCSRGSLSIKMLFSSLFLMAKTNFRRGSWTPREEPFGTIERSSFECCMCANNESRKF